MSPDDVQIRLDICEGCAAPCPEHLAGEIKHRDPCAACPRRVWHAHGECGVEGEPELEQVGIGLGDVVAAVAQPVARVIDAITRGRTDLANCGGCARRKARLNSFRRGLIGR